MAQSTPDQVATYLSQVAAKRDLSAMLQPSGLEAAESADASKSRQLASDGIKKIMAGSPPTVEQSAQLEAIILPKIRPVLDVVDGDFSTDHPLWLKLNRTTGDTVTRNTLRSTLTSIGRIELPGNPDGIPYGGTGFVVGDGLVMTNRHVAAIFASGLGTRVTFRPGLKSGIDFVRELERPNGQTFAVTRIVMIHPYWDMALLAVEGLPRSASPLHLRSSDVPAGVALEVAAIGYPAFDTRNDVDVQNDLFRRVFGVKRLLPGTLDGRGDTESFGKILSALRHNCSTLGGNSGSALIDFATGNVVALHFGGRFKVINFGVPTSELARDPRVIDAGVIFEPATVATVPPAWEDFWTRAEERVEAEPRATAAASGAVSTPVARTDRGRAMSDGAVEFTIPLHVTIRIGAAAGTSTSAGVTVESDSGIEKLAIPFHDEEYDSRTGYDPKFTGVNVPMPKAADTSVVARAKDGSRVLHYQNFSIVMHAARRMALFTASNVTAESDLKKPEAGKKYTRKALSGLGENDQERWFPDPRLGDEFQLPDVFYTRDDGAFDKGHVVRREDVAWGETYDLLRRANGDTYHVTNCSPQVAGFNRSTLGEDNWGDLEDHVLAGASSERLCQFAGPVLDPADEVFVGAGGGRVKLRVKIPSRFWKVIVARTTQGIASFGFMLEQDLSAVSFEEFVVGDQFVKSMVPLQELQDRIGVKFPDAVLDADQFGTDEGVDVARRAGVKRRSGAAAPVNEGVVV